MRTAVPRSRALATALALLVAMSSFFAGATTAGALDADADAVGIRADLDVTVGAVATSVEGTIGHLSGSPSDTTQVADTDASLGDDTATVTADVVRSQVVSSALQSRAESGVTGASVSVPLLDDLLGDTLVTTDATVIRAEAICPAGAPPTATVDPLASVTIAGTDVVFDADGVARAELDVEDVGAGTVELQRATTVVTTSTAAAAALTLDVSVLLADGADSVSGTVTIAEVSCEAPAAPVVGAIDPAQGPTAGGTLVQTSGTGFVPGATTVDIGGNVVPASAVSVGPAGDSLTFLTPAHAAGQVGITATTPDGTTDLLGFLYVAPASSPTATGITPAAGPVTGGTAVTITGTGFQPGVTTLTVGGISVPSSDIVVALGGASLTFATPAHGAGPVDVAVTAPGGTTTPAVGFTYVALTGTAPTTTAITPAEGPTTGGTVVQVSGTGFVPGATSVTVGGLAVPASEVVVALGGTTLTFATPPHDAGAVGVTVTTPGGTTTSVLGFTYLAPAGPAPTVTAIAPDEGPITGGTTVTITGTGFVPGATSVTIGGIALASGEVVAGPDGTSLTFTTPPHAAGAVDVTVSTTGGSSTPALGFTYAAVPPTATELDIHQGPTAGGTKVTITGTAFVPGGTTVTLGDVVIPADEVDVADDGMSLSFTTPAHDAGAVAVTVTTPDGTTSPALTYTYAGPAGAGTGTGTSAGTNGTTAATGAGNGATGGRLASTGSEVADLVVLALAAIGTGGTLLWFRRRALRHTAAAA